MKKIFLIAVLIIGSILLSGCEQTKKVTCTKEVSSTDGSTKISLEYLIYYNNDKNVVKTESTEKITSASGETLEEYKKSYENIFDKYKDIKYYDTSVVISGSTLISKIRINYNKLDYKKVLEIEGQEGNIFNDDGKVKVDTLVNLYETTGSECDY